MCDEIKQNKSEKKARYRELEDIREILDLKSGAGKRFMRRGMEEYGLLRNPFTGNSTTFMNCGMQSAAQWLFSELLEANEVVASKILIDLNQKEK